MILIDNKFFAGTIEPGKIYCFYSPTLVKTTKPHYYVVIAISPDNLIIFGCVTSQSATHEKLLAAQNLPNNTLVWIKPSSENNLPLDSYINCNYPVEHTMDFILEKNKTGQLQFKGYATEAVLEQLKTGILSSPLVNKKVKNIIKNTL